MDQQFIIVEGVRKTLFHGLNMSPTLNTELCVLFRSQNMWNGPAQESATVLQTLDSGSHAVTYWILLWDVLFHFGQ